MLLGVRLRCGSDYTNRLRQSPEHLLVQTLQTLSGDEVGRASVLFFGFSEFEPWHVLVLPWP